MDAQPSPIETFITRWQGREGGAERANFPLFIAELCATLAALTRLGLLATRDGTQFTYRPQA